MEAVPESEEWEADKESERSAELRYEGDGRVDPGLLLVSDVSGDVVVAQHEQTADKQSYLSVQGPQWR